MLNILQVAYYYFPSPPPPHPDTYVCQDLYKERDKRKYDDDKLAYFSNTCI